VGFRLVIDTSGRESSAAFLTTRSLMSRKRRDSAVVIDRAI
jgi:hypothetical protein